MFPVKSRAFCLVTVAHVPQAKGLLKMFSHTFPVQITSAGVNSGATNQSDAKLWGVTFGNQCFRATTRWLKEMLRQRSESIESEVLNCPL
jgi:hypothetical protein